MRHLNLSRRVSLTLLLAAGLAGCAPPRYQTVYRLEPPADAAGRVCIERCAGGLTDCQSRCAQAYQVCAQALEPLFQERYAQALQRYEDALDRYAAELRHYELQAWLSWRRWWYDPWPLWFPYPPPRKPSREAVREELRKERCTEDCGCLTQHEACFLACGGRKIAEERCVADCPPGSR
jgi:hypothetical protein